MAVKEAGKGEKKRQSKKKAAVSELDQPVWAVINGIECFATNLTYAQAVTESKKRSKSSIVTEAVAARLTPSK